MSEPAVTAPAPSAAAPAPSASAQTFTINGTFNGDNIVNNNVNNNFKVSSPYSFCPCHLLLSQGEEMDKGRWGKYHARFIPTILK